uniref:Uncharacterized protein n=1 Tax=Rousettus aegyptiacus TaxID=9407 RepID=A0A7J8CIT8_ROUAE|nr:hypothetical protein HJG63_009207 [Rousettus aegyptiacus]
MTLAVSWACKRLTGRHEKASTFGWRPELYDISDPSITPPKSPSGLHTQEPTINASARPRSCDSGLQVEPKHPCFESFADDSKVLYDAFALNCNILSNKHYSTCSCPSHPCPLIQEAVVAKPEPPELEKRFCSYPILFPS